MTKKKRPLVKRDSGRCGTNMTRRSDRSLSATTNAAAQAVAGVVSVFRARLEKMDEREVAASGEGFKDGADHFAWAAPRSREVNGHQQRAGRGVGILKRGQVWKCLNAHRWP